MDIETPRNTHSQIISRLARPLEAGLGCVAGIRWAPRSGVVAPHGVLNLDNLGPAQTPSQAQQVRNRIRTRLKRVQAEFLVWLTLGLLEFVYSTAATKKKGKWWAGQLLIFRFWRNSSGLIAFLSYLFRFLFFIFLSFSKHTPANTLVMSRTLIPSKGSVEAPPHGGLSVAEALDCEEDETENNLRQPVWRATRTWDTRPRRTAAEARQENGFIALAWMVQWYF